jgi:hypothetical protein
MHCALTAPGRTEAADTTAGCEGDDFKWPAPKQSLSPPLPLHPPTHPPTIPPTFIAHLVLVDLLLRAQVLTDVALVQHDQRRRLEARACPPT